MNKTIRYFLTLATVFSLIGPAAGPCAQEETQILKAKIFLETYPLLSDTDLYCSFFIPDGALPELRVSGAERQEKMFYSDGDVVYLQAGRAQGLAVGQLLLAFEVGPMVEHPRTKEKFGPLCFRKGRISIIHVEVNRAAGRIEKTCGAVQMGDALVPFEVKQTVEGKSEGFVPYTEPKDRLSGTVIYLTDQLNQVSYGNWVLIDIGREQGLKAGQQLVVFHQPQKGLPRRTVASGVVVDVQARTSTLKILASEDAVILGDGVEVKDIR